jgi:allantoinase
MPGLVDAHVHLNDPGRQSWETFATGTRAALKGGVLTLVDMPLNSIPSTTTVSNLETKLASARGNTFVNVGFYGGVVPGNAEHLGALVDRGVRGFKCFMIDSGVEEFPCVNEAEIRLAMQTLLPYSRQTFLMFHAELPQTQTDDNECTIAGAQDEDPAAYQTFLHSRPRSMENAAISMVIRLCREYRDLPCHIVHLSSAEALPMIQQAKQEGLPLTVETCFHYLTLSAEQVPRGTYITRMHKLI